MDLKEYKKTLPSFIACVDVNAADQCNKFKNVIKIGKKQPL